LIRLNVLGRVSAGELTDINIFADDVVLRPERLGEIQNWGGLLGMIIKHLRLSAGYAISCVLLSWHFFFVQGFQGYT
jgi:hypothetical protein